MSIGGNTSFEWPDGVRIAISLSFDDGRESQVDRCIPLLDEYGVKGSFYVSLGNVEKRLDEWRSAAQGGHEMGNHTLTHPCSETHCFARDNALEDSSLARMAQEIDGASEALAETFGQRPRTFAYPCGETFVGRGEELQSYIPLVARRFLAGRGWLGHTHNVPASADMAHLQGVSVDGASFDQLAGPIADTHAQNAWLVLAGHDVGDNPAHQTVLPATLRALCEYARDPDNGVWLDTVAAVAEYVVGVRGGSAHRRDDGT